MGFSGKCGTCGEPLERLDDDCPKCFPPEDKKKEKKDL
jgi:predicted amidophosphoribosyltransferase